MPLRAIFWPKKSLEPLTILISILSHRKLPDILRMLRRRFAVGILSVAKAPGLVWCRGKPPQDHEQTTDKGETRQYTRWKKEKRWGRSGVWWHYCSLPSHAGRGQDERVPGKSSNVSVNHLVSAFVTFQQLSRRVFEKNIKRKNKINLSSLSLEVVDTLSLVLFFLKRNVDMAKSKKQRIRGGIKKKWGKWEIIKIMKTKNDSGQVLFSF